MNQEETVELDLPVLLPDIEDAEDECLIRFKDSLMEQRGIIHTHLERDTDPTRLCIHYQPNQISLKKVQRIAHRSGTALMQRYHHARIPFSGMNTADGAITLRSVLERLPGLLHAQVNYAAGLASVAYDSTTLDPMTIARTMQNLGIHPINWPPHVEEDEDEHDHESIPAFVPGWMHDRWELILVGLAGIFLLIGWVGETFLALPTGLTILFYAVSYLAGAYDISTHAIPGLLKGKFDTDVLMLAAAVGAAILGEWAEGAFLLVLFGIGHAGEHYALDRARNAVNELGELMPKTARVRAGDKLIERSVYQLQIGEVVLVPPGDRIPVDGHILCGESSVDQSPITGESVPVPKYPGEAVYAGTVNQDALLEVEITRLAKDNTLSRIMRMVVEAQSQQSPSQRFAEKFTSRFVPAVLIFVLLVITIPPLVGWMPLQASFYRAMILLVAASPCALALGTPASVLAGIARAARNGVLIKGGAHLENLGGLQAIAFDKTGTLTHGKFKVTDVVPLNGHRPDELLRVAAAVEQGSNHPIARAVVETAYERNLSFPPATSLINVTGLGVRCSVGDQPVRIGSLKFFHAEPDLDVDTSIQEVISNLEADGKTVMLVCRSGEFMGAMGLADVSRSGVKSILNELRNAGVNALIMLTGDNHEVANRIAHDLGLTHVRAGLLPDQKLQAVNQLRAEYGDIAMVGDGVNDAPALATATVGIAMGGAGTAVALETADVALMGDDLSKLPFAVSLSRASRAIIRQNLGIALGVIGLLLVTSVSGVLPLNWAVVLHEGSSIVVVLNALRLLGFRS